LRVSKELQRLQALQPKPSAPLPLTAFAGPTGGSLRYDRVWLKQARNRLVQAVNENTNLAPLLGSADDVLVPWAGDVGGSRVAYVIFPASRSSPTPVTGALLIGPRGARARDLELYDARSWPAPGPSRQAEPLYLDTSWAATAKHPDLVLVAAPTATSVKIAAARHFRPDGRFSTDWHALTKQGGVVWVGRLNAAEASMSDLLVKGADVGHQSLENDPLIPGLRSVAAAGTTFEGLLSTQQVLSELGASTTDRPLFLTSAQNATEAWTAAALRTSDGPGLVAFSYRSWSADGRPQFYPDWAYAGVTPGIGDPDNYMAALEVPHPEIEFFVTGRNLSDPDPVFKPIPRYVVLAPLGATTVQIGQRRAPVYHRLAILNSEVPGPATVQAFAADGTVIATVQSVRALAPAER
jgi:hypothetical protein